MRAPAVLMSVARALPQALALALLIGGGATTGVAAGVEGNPCPEAAAPVGLGSAQWNGWGRDLDNTRYQPEPAIRAMDVPRLAVKWAYGFAGSAVSGQPTVVDGRVFVTTSTGRIYSLDSKRGCTYWTYDAQAGSRTAISIAEFAKPRQIIVSKKTKRKLAHVDVVKAPSAAFFGDDSGAVYALDAQKGTLLWKTQVDAQPHASILGAPTLYHDRLYVAVASNEPRAGTTATNACCTSRGSVAALDITTGRVLWKTYTIDEEARPSGKTGAGVASLGPAGAAVSVSPTVDAKHGVLYIGTGASLTTIAQPMADAVVALDLADGRTRWVKQLSRQDTVGAADFGSSLVLRTLGNGRRILLAGQKSGIVYGLDPDRGGEVLWQSKLGEASGNATEGGASAGGGVEWGLAADYRSVFIALSGLASEPPNPSGSFSAVDMKTGVRRWHTGAPTPACSWGAEACSHAQAQAVTVMPGVAFSGSMDGHLRAYSTIDGKIVWDVDTAKDFATVNGVKASGGSLDQGGATIVNGIVFINSGYGQRAGQPGNVLLAFSVDGK